MKKLIFFLGPTGSGKTSQAEILSGKYGWQRLSTGDILRAKPSEEVQRQLHEGRLIDDRTMLQLVMETLEQFPEDSTVVIDGFPRSLAQAQELQAHLGDNQQVQDALFFEVTEEESVRRLLTRGRDDDSEDVIKRKWQIFHEVTEPVLDFYEQHGLLRRVDGIGPKEEVTARVEKVLSS